MRLRSFIIPVLALTLAAPRLFGSDHPLPPPEDATKYADVDTHPDEHLSIAAEPFDTKEKMKYFRVDYLKNYFMPIRIIVTNNGDKPVSLEQARIDFITSKGDRIAAAEPADVERRMTHVNNTGRSVPMPPPLPPMGGNPLPGARLSFRKVADADGKQFYPYDIWFDKYLGNQKNTAQQ